MNEIEQKKSNRLCKCPECKGDMALSLTNEGMGVTLDGEQSHECCQCHRVCKESELPLLQPQQPADSSASLTIKGELAPIPNKYNAQFDHDRWAAYDEGRQDQLAHDLVAIPANLQAKGWLSPEQAKSLTVERDKYKAMAEILQEQKLDLGDMVLKLREQIKGMMELPSENELARILHKIGLPHTKGHVEQLLKLLQEGKDVERK